MYIYYTSKILIFFTLIFKQHVKIGDLILGTIVSKTTSGMMLKVLCTAGSTVRYVADINVKVTYIDFFFIHIIRAV